MKDTYDLAQSGEDRVASYYKEERVFKYHQLAIYATCTPWCNANSSHVQPLLRTCIGPVRKGLGCPSGMHDAFRI